MFGFDERYAMFDITPVENLFILEYLPEARGDYVKVYLYGLMRCYHPEEDMSLNRMCHELNMTEEDVTAAFRYWERRRLVRRVSDQPPRWQYVNVKQTNLINEPDIDPDYEEFSNAICEAFDKVRRLHGSELNTCFEWREGSLKLPTEVIAMLLNHMAEIKGRNFRISEAEKVAVLMASENIRTVDAAEEFFSRDEKAYKGIRKVLKKLGKQYAPSEAQVNLYRKWTREWHFSPDAIEAALELTAKGDPSLGYLDGILNSLRQEYGDGAALTPEKVRQSASRGEGLKEVLKELGKGDINARTLQLYDQMTELYSREIILIAARECGHSGGDAGDILKLLNSWKEKGLESLKDVKAYVQAFHDQTSLIREMRRIWGTDEKKIGKQDRSLVSKWENELGFSKELILAAAPYASEAKQPMAYLDRILADYREKGINTPEEAQKEHGNSKPGTETGKKAGRVLPAQDFAQRDYSEVQDEMMKDLAREMEAFRKENGGQADA